MNKYGNGIGLSICKQICKRLGGDINVESKRGVGTKFKFTMVVRNYSEHPVLNTGINSHVNEAIEQHTELFDLEAGDHADIYELQLFVENERELHN